MPTKVMRSLALCSVIVSAQEFGGVLGSDPKTFLAQTISNEKKSKVLKDDFEENCGVKEGRSIKTQFKPAYEEMKKFKAELENFNKQKSDQESMSLPIPVQPAAHSMMEAALCFCYFTEKIVGKSKNAVDLQAVAVPEKLKSLEEAESGVLISLLKNIKEPHAYTKSVIAYADTLVAYKRALTLEDPELATQLQRIRQNSRYLTRHSENTPNSNDREVRGLLWDEIIYAEDDLFEVRCGRDWVRHNVTQLLLFEEAHGKMNEFRKMLQGLRETQPSRLVKFFPVVGKRLEKKERESQALKSSAIVGQSDMIQAAICFSHFTAKFDGYDKEAESLREWARQSLRQTADAQNLNPLAQFENYQKVVKDEDDDEEKSRTKNYPDEQEVKDYSRYSKFAMAYAGTLVNYSKALTRQDSTTKCADELKRIKTKSQYEDRHSTKLQESKSDCNYAEVLEFLWDEVIYAQEDLSKFNEENKDVWAFEKECKIRKGREISWHLEDTYDFMSYSPIEVYRFGKQKLDQHGEKLMSPLHVQTLQKALRFSYFNEKRVRQSRDRKEILTNLHKVAKSTPEAYDDFFEKKHLTFLDYFEKHSLHPVTRVVMAYADAQTAYKRALLLGDEKLKEESDKIKGKLGYKVRHSAKTVNWNSENVLDLLWDEVVYAQSDFEKERNKYKEIQVQQFVNVELREEGLDVTKFSESYWNPQDRFQQFDKHCGLELPDRYRLHHIRAYMVGHLESLHDKGILFKQLLFSFNDTPLKPAKKEKTMEQLQYHQSLMVQQALCFSYAMEKYLHKNEGRTVVLKELANPDKLKDLGKASVDHDDSSIDRYFSEVPVQDTHVYTQKALAYAKALLKYRVALKLNSETPSNPPPPNMSNQITEAGENLRKFHWETGYLEMINYKLEVKSPDNSRSRSSSSTSSTVSTLSGLSQMIILLLILLKLLL